MANKALLLAFAFSVACAANELGPPPQTQTDLEGCERGRVAMQDPALVVIQTRDHDVAVHALDHQLSFTVSQADSGALLAVRLTELEFSTSFPKLHEGFRTAFAEDAPKIWAGL